MTDSDTEARRALPERLPDTPAEVLEVSVAALRPVIAAVTGLARRLGFWDRPLRGSAAAIEEMGPLDNLYWIHKSATPVRLPEKGSAVVMDRDLATIALPEGMSPTHEVTLGAGGDLLRSPGIDGSQDRLFAEVAGLLFDQDIAFANYESPVTKGPLIEEVIGDAGPPTECASPAQFEILTSHEGRRFDLLNLTNNHAFDMGLDGIEATRAAVVGAGMVPVGAPDVPEAHGQAVIIERGGIRIGFASAAFGLNGRDLPEDAAWRLHLSDLSSKRKAPDMRLLEAQIDDARTQGCDFVIAAIHWGHEFEMMPRDAQVAAARALVEHGADAIICAHPHVVQPAEVYRPARDPARAAIIAYSLGSLTWSFMAPHIALSAILNLRLVKGTLDGAPVTHIAAARITPVLRSYLPSAGGMVTVLEPLDRLTGEVARGRGAAEAARIATARELAAEILGSEP